MSVLDQLFQAERDCFAEKVPCRRNSVPPVRNGQGDVVHSFSEPPMEIHVETLSVGTWVKARIVLQSGRSNTELANLNMTRAQWDDFTKCLSHSARVKQGRIVFAPGQAAGPRRAEAVA